MAFWILVACTPSGTLDPVWEPVLPTEPYGPSEPTTPPVPPPLTSPTTPTTPPEPTPDMPVVTTEWVPDMAVLTLDPPPGLFEDSITVNVAVSDPTATLHVTLDGTVPTPLTPVWVGPVTIDRSTPVRALALGTWGSLETAAVYLALDPALSGHSSNLPQVVLWTLDGAPAWKTEVYTSATLSVFNPDAGGRVTFPANASMSHRAGFKIRGSSSSGYPKHPYRVEAWGALDDEDLDIPLLGMPADGDWIFGAPLDFDRALMRDPLAFELSNAIGRYAPRTAAIELFVAENGEAVGLDDYVGVYQVAERIERGEDRVPITEMSETNVSYPEITGGYLFKEDRTGPGEVGFWAGSDGGLYFQQPFVLVDPNEAEIVPQQWDWLEAELDELGVALTSPGFTHPITGRHYDEIIDVDSFIDHHVINVLTKNPDAFRLSGYFHQDRLAPLAAGPVWDFDRTMGCSSDSRAEDPEFWDASNITPDCTFFFDHGFYGGLFDDSAFRDRVWARWRELLDGALSVEAMHEIIDRRAAELDEAAVRNFQVWSSYPPRGGDFASEVTTLKDWLAARHAWIDGCLDLPDPRTCVGD